MANSKIPNLNLSDTLNTQRLRFNQLLDSVGDVSTLTTTAGPVTDAINELDAELGTITSGAMGTTASTVSGAIAELDGRFGLVGGDGGCGGRCLLQRRHVIPLGALLARPHVVRRVA